MAFFTQARTSGGPLAADEAHKLLDGVLLGSPFGGVFGLIDQLKQGGLAEQIEGWREGVPTAVGPEELRAALGNANVEMAAASLGVSPDEMLNDLVAHLPAIVAHLG